MPHKEIVNKVSIVNDKLEYRQTKQNIENYLLNSVERRKVAIKEFFLFSCFAFRTYPQLQNGKFHMNNKTHFCSGFAAEVHVIKSLYKYRLGRADSYLFWPCFHLKMKETWTERKNNSHGREKNKRWISSNPWPVCSVTNNWNSYIFISSVSGFS